ncbi:MAG: CinA family protein [Candidatus Omnitrophica bacterium]|nr:CinA family protein [Candidatus Omnitrophota bacterium]
MINGIAKLAHDKLIANNKTIAIAESCSGGQLASELIRYPGASRFFILGVVAYSNKSKVEILGVPRKLISQYGAVSKQVAGAMAQNIRKKVKADLGLSITGLAGPSGESAKKPVGLVFICLDAANKNTCRKFNFRGTRQNIREKSAKAALRLLCAHLSP